MTTPSIDPQLKHILQVQRAASFDLLLRVDRIDDEREQALHGRGVAIRRRLTLVPTFAVTCTGAAGLSLLDLPWIQRIEEDRPVYAL